MGMVSVLDPTAVFCVFCLSIPLFKDPNTTNADRVAYVTDPFFWGSLAVLLVLPAILVRQGRCVPLSTFERARGRWYLWNASVIHWMMDGGVGCFQQLPLLDKMYKELDGRFRDRESCAAGITSFEFFVMVPLALAVYWGIRRGCPWRYATELVLCSVQLMGTYLFVGTEVYEGFPNVVTDFNFEFSRDQIVYFWFGFSINFIWVIVPLYFGSLAWSSATQASRAAPAPRAERPHVD
ncbi:putative 3-Beta-hydroxysteroid-delta(8) [Diplonema papillatum]|nr:putative 3-Beta-hydroxysteroid-delta(8) [Diplonema papillatum]